MRNRLTTYLCVLLFSLTLTGCSIMQAVALKDCTYTYDRITNVTFLGLEKRDLISFTGAARMGKALLGKADEVPLGFTLHLKVDNPNKMTASVDRVFYTVMLDTIQVASGCSNEALIVPSETQVDFPMQFSFDLKTLLSSGSYPTLANLVKNFIGIGKEPTMVTIQLKPVIRVNGVALGVPRPITLTFPYGGSK